MRLMLGDTSGKPSLLVDVTNVTHKTLFDFYAVNGDWFGTYTNGYITVHGCPSGDFTSLGHVMMLCHDQDRLRGSYQDVFDNFHDVNYNAPKTKTVPASWDDDIPF